MTSREKKALAAYMKLIPPTILSFKYNGEEFVIKVGSELALVNINGKDKFMKGYNNDY